MRYGQFVHQVMAANYPQWAKPLSTPPLSQNEKIRIGYISNCMRSHTVGKLMLGWMLQPPEFEVYCLHDQRRTP